MFPGECSTFFFCIHQKSNNGKERHPSCIQVFFIVNYCSPLRRAKQGGRRQAHSGQGPLSGREVPNFQDQGSPTIARPSGQVSPGVLVGIMPQESDGRLGARQVSKWTGATQRNTLWALWFESTWSFGQRVDITGPNVRTPENRPRGKVRIRTRFRIFWPTPRSNPDKFRQFSSNCQCRSPDKFEKFWIGLVTYPDKFFHEKIQ